MPTKTWNEEVDRWAANISAHKPESLTGSETGDVPSNWKEMSNGNAPDAPKVTPIAGGRVPTSAVKWKQVEVLAEEVPQSEERMNRFQRENKRRKESR